MFFVANDPGRSWGTGNILLLGFIPSCPFSLSPQPYKLFPPSEIAKDEAIMMDTHKTCEKVMEGEGYVLDEEFKKSKRKDLTVNEFALTHPYGTYFLNTHGHLLCVKDGEYWDSWDSGKKKVRRIYIKKNEE